MKKITLGILAHVDAGKTTLNEALLYHGGVIRRMGRVDHQDSYLDYDIQEKKRGITIFSKTASLTYGDSRFTLVDTPGHLDFAGEMERTLSVLDYVVVVVSGLDGVQSHTRTIWKLLEYYDLPAFVFVNKMDIALRDEGQLLAQLNEELDGPFVSFGNLNESYEDIALLGEELMEEYLKTGSVDDESIASLINERKLFPVYFGSALKDQGVKQLLDGLDNYTMENIWPEEFGLRIYKISYDEAGKRWCYGKITGGSLKAKERIGEEGKIDELCLISGQKMTTVAEASAGDIVAFRGPEGLQAGQGLGFEKSGSASFMEPFMRYKVILPEGCDKNMMLKQLQILAQEDPQIRVSAAEEMKDIHVSLMGEIQIEVITNIIKKRTGVTVGFGEGAILYRETIENAVEGVGHFEPLRHYAEVHLRLQPLPRGAGLVFANEVPEGTLAVNWQRLIMTHLQEKRHLGVLTRSPITDMKITVIAGKAHEKHTEGGDFRQATYRAVRQGLKKARSVLLEPYYGFIIQAQRIYLSSLLYDLDNMKAQYKLEDVDEDRIRITGSAPVRLMQNYHQTLMSHSGGAGQLSLSVQGYDRCLDEQKIIEEIGYDSESDLRNPTGSVFCQHGAGFYVPWDQVENYMHIKAAKLTVSSSPLTHNRYSISESELKSVFANVNGRNRNIKKKYASSRRSEDEKKKTVIRKARPRLLIADGYNLMHYFRRSSSMSEENFDGARDLIINQLSSYAGYKGCKVIAVFDAYKKEDNYGKVDFGQEVSVVYTRQNQTADSYIEKLVHDYSKDYEITVASSDQAVQNMIVTNGGLRMSARELELELEGFEKQALDSQYMVREKQR
ncbi:MAG: NYN domain-containing protein [Erysipelotrichaceae bacterium]|nr:NYN domain-containing protein [Erysipelotrichaceae bacterium]